MNVEQARITSRAERLDAQAAGFLTRRPHHIAECFLHRALASRARMETREDEHFHAPSSTERASSPHRTSSSARPATTAAAYQWNPASADRGSARSPRGV